MNVNYRRVPTKFGPETGFEVKPALPAPFAARQEAELEQMRARLLAERQAGAGGPQSANMLRRAADEAAALAWVMRYPLLLFPSLFEEKAEAAMRQAERQEEVRRRSRELLAA